ncbi:hypothetical protein BGW42_006435 [Actinomortierella wolfii]|nr:hypothetical protein BGW42_006435 [Actinomortierella wolfii]
MSSRASSIRQRDDMELPFGSDEVEYQDVDKIYSKDGMRQNTASSTGAYDLDGDEESMFEEYYDKSRPMPIRIAQSMMNSVNMYVVQMNMTQPKETSVHVSVHATVMGIPKIFSATLEFQEQVVVSWDNRLIGSMNLAPVHVKKGDGNFWQETTFFINDTTAFGDFAKTLMSADMFSWTMKSKATVKAFGLSIKNLSIDKTLPMNGLSNFANVQLLSFDLPGEAPEGANIYIKAEIPNPSPIGMMLGTVTLDLSYKTAYLGRVVAKDVTLVGGQPMLLECEGVLLKQTDPVHLQELSELISNYLGDIPAMASAQGVSVYPDGINQVSWITKAITTAKMTVPLKAVQKLDVIKDVSLNDMDLSLTAASPWTPTVSSTAVGATFEIPFNIKINITDLRDIVIKMAYDGHECAELTTAVWNRTSSDMSNNRIVFTVPPSQFTIQEAGRDAFQKFLTSVTQQDTSTLDVIGRATGVAETSLGTVTLYVPLRTSVPLQGINFSKAKPTVSDIKVTNGTTTGVSISANVGIVNPSIFSVNMDRVTLVVSCTIEGQTEIVGMATIPSMIIRPGQNTISGLIHYNPSNAEFSNKFLSIFVAGGTINATIHGHDQSTDIISIAPTLESLSLNTMLPGMTPPAQILTGGNGTPTLGAILGSRRIPLTVTALNPLDTTIWLNTITADVLWRDVVFGSVTNAHIPFALPPHTEVRSPQFPVQCPMGLQFALFLATQFLPLNPQVITGGTVLVDIRAKLDVTLGGPVGIGYLAALNYEQKAIPAYLKLDVSFVGLTKRAYEADHPGLSVDEHAIYNWVVSQIGSEPPREDSQAYIRWIQHSLAVLYSEDLKILQQPIMM